MQDLHIQVAEVYCIYILSVFLLKLEPGWRFLQKLYTKIYNFTL